MTIRELAHISGLSKTTVADALRNDPKVSSKTRRRVKTLAAEHGYLPSPQINQFMQGVRAGKLRKRQFSLAYLSSRGLPRNGSTYPYEQQIINGAMAEAESLGYCFTLIDCNQYSASRLETVLLSRGVRGVLLGPAEEPHAELNLNWSRFAVVRSGYSFDYPDSDLIAPDIFQAVEYAIDQAVTMGYARVIVGINAKTDERVGRRWLSAATTQSALRKNNQIVIVRGELDYVIDQLILQTQNSESTVVIGHLEMLTRLEKAGKRFPQDMGFISFDHSECPQHCTAIVQPFRECGRRTITQLSMLVEHSQWGLPEIPARFTLKCGWREGATTTRKLVAAS